MRIDIKRTAILLAALVAFPCGELLAQTREHVKGTVKDVAGEPIFEAVVLDASGEKLGSTDLFGRFELEQVDSGQLRFLKSGYEVASATREVGQDAAEAGPAVVVFAVTMRRDVSRKDEVLDYGYNVKRRRGLLSEAVSAIDGKLLEDIPTSSFSQMLEGQLLGLGTQEDSSDPGNASVSKYVRGMSTIHDHAPLIVLDGIIMQDYNVDYLTAAEIENVVVLKDAAAMAIYGLKGSNGVIVINTKSGLPGTFDVRVTADMAVQQISRQPERFSSLDYATLRNQAWRNDGASGDAPFSDYEMEQIRLGTNPLYPSNDYYKEFVRPMGTMERLGVTVSGGSQKTRVWSNINFMNQTSLFRQQTEEYVAAPRRFWVNFRAKVDVDISRHVRAMAGVAGNIRNDRLAGNGITNGTIYNSIFSLPPTMMGPVTDDGRVVTMETVESPTYGILNRSGYTKYTGMYLSTYAGLSIDLDFITRGLTLSGKVAFQSSNDRMNYSTQDYRRYYYDYVQGDFRQLGSSIDSNLSNGAEGKFQYALNFIAQLDYERQFGKHGVDAHLFTYYTDEQHSTVVADYPAVGMPYYNLNSGLNAGYNYDDRYVVSATLGLTASDVFPRKNRFTFVPAASVAWVASNEAFLRDVEWLSLLKVRASYGMVASDSFDVGYFRYLYTDYVQKNGNIRLLGNPDLKPEKHLIQNYGIEVGLWNKLNFSFDYFRRHTDNMLIESGNSIPAFQGIYPSSYMKVNEGEMRNRGIELGLDYATDLGRGWSIRAGVNWSHAKNEVVYVNEMPYPEAGPGYSGYSQRYLEQGHPYGQVFGYLIDRSNGNGYINTDEELARYTEMYEFGTPRKGDFIYRDVNGDGKINEKDVSPIGNGQIPTDFTTFRVGFGWKGLELDLMFQGVLGYYGVVDYQSELSANGLYNDMHLKSWTPERYAAGETIEAPAMSYSSTSTSMSRNEYNYADRSFWRLKNASLSYTLPQRLMRNAGISRLKIVLSGQNLFTTSKLASRAIDPEMGSMTVLPPMRVVNLGVKIDF